MCRLMLMNREAFDLLKDEVYFLMLHLELAMGGHGNGVAILRDSRISIQKGVKFSVEDAYTFASSRKWDWLIFHTRLASVGDINDKNCHPFRYGHTVLAMNGTEKGFEPIAQGLGGITDTEAILLTYKKLGVPIPYSLTRLSSAFVGFHKGKPFAVCAGHSDMKVWTKGNAIVIASEYPDYWDKDWGKPLEALNGFVWYDGEYDSKLLTTKTYRYVKLYRENWNNYLYGFDDYNDLNKKGGLKNVK